MNAPARDGAFLAALLGGAACLAAQEPDSARRIRVTLEPGTVLVSGVHAHRDVALRWQAPSQDRLVVTGTFLSHDADSLRVDPDGAAEAFAVPWASVAKLERHAGRRHHAGTFALAFGVPGALVGALGGAAFCTGDYYCEQGPGMNALEFGLIIGGGSALLGAVVGRAVTTDRWERTEVPLIVTPTVIEGRVGAAISLRF